MDRARVEVTVRPLVGQDGPVEREMEECLAGVARAAVLATMYPRTQIAITVQVVHDDGALLATAINAVLLALMDAGVALTSLLPAVCCALCVPRTLPGEQAASPAAPVLVLDPSAEEEQAALCCFTLAFTSDQLASLAAATPAEQIDVAFCHTRGVFDFDAEGLPAIRAGALAAKTVAEVFRKTARSVQQATKGTMLDVGSADVPTKTEQ